MFDMKCLKFKSYLILTFDIVDITLQIAIVF